MATASRIGEKQEVNLNKPEELEFVLSLDKNEAEAIVYYIRLCHEQLGRTYEDVAKQARNGGVSPTSYKASGVRVVEVLESLGVKS